MTQRKVVINAPQPNGIVLGQPLTLQVNLTITQDDKTQTRWKNLYDQLKAKIQKHLLMDDFQLLDVLIATYVAHHFASDPLWLMIIAPPASSKTELISGLSGLEDVFPLSDLTDKTLFSGLDKPNQDEPSLIKQIEGKIVTMKDFTTIIQMRPEKRGEVMAQFREIYDGAMTKAWGTGKRVVWHGKVGLIVCVTPAIDEHMAVFQTLGERFIQIRIRPLDEISVAKKAMQTTGKEEVNRKEIADLMAEFCNLLVKQTSKTPPPIPENIISALAGLASLCVRARSSVRRDGYSKDILYIPETEAPARLAKQLKLLAQGLAAARGAESVGESDYWTVFRVGLDCMPSLRSRVIELILNETEITISDVGIIGGTATRLFQDMILLDLLQKNESDKYTFSERVFGYLPLMFPKSTIGS